MRAQQSDSRAVWSKIRQPRSRQAQVSKEELNEAVAKSGLRKRDIMVLESLAQYGILDSHHIVKLTCAGLKKATRMMQKQRLGQLVEAGFLGRAYAEHHNAYYWLEKLGLAWAKAERLMIKHANLTTWQHSLLTADFMIAVLDEAKRRGGEAEWKGEAELGSWRAATRPDAVGEFRIEVVQGIEARQLRMEFGMETDRRTMSETRIKKKVVGYESERKRGQAVPQVLLVTTAGERGITNLCAAIAEKLQATGSPVKWFVTNFARLKLYTHPAREPYYGPLSAPIWSNPLSSGEPIGLLPPELIGQEVSRT